MTADIVLLVQIEFHQQVVGTAEFAFDLDEKGALDGSLGSLQGVVSRTGGSSVAGSISI